MQMLHGKNDIQYSLVWAVKMTATSILKVIDLWEF